jgi:hypothetical protein
MRFDLPRLFRRYGNQSMTEIIVIAREGTQEII